MKKNLVMLTLVVLILIISVLAIASAKSLKTDKEVRIFRPSKSFERAKRNKRIIADNINEKDIKLFRNKGCLIKHRLKDSVSFECPKNIPISKAREARVFHVLDLEADQQIEADKVWLEGIEGQGVNIVVLDTGIDDSHIELSDSIKGQKDFVNNDDIAEDDNGHGTHVAGIITANGIYQINSNYATGVAPDAGIYMLKVCDASGSCYEDDMMAAMEYAINLDAKIMSISIGGGNYGSHCDSDPLAAKVNEVVDAGFTVVVAAGNEGSGVSSPACASKAIAVGTTDKSNIIPFWSNYGTALDIIAPGVDILSTYSCLAAGDCSSYWYAWMDGTSMSTPHVSGVAALLLQTKPTATTDEIKNALYSTAEPAAGCQECRWYWRGKCYRPSIKPCTSEREGAGIVNAYEAYLAIKPSEPPIACHSNADCNDENECTNDVCENPGAPEASCSNTPVADSTPCDDSQFCTTNDVCTAGVCGGKARDCSDAIACTVDSCDENIDACVNTPNNLFCDDGLFCNGVEICNALLGCQLGIPIDCNDNNKCTIDSCNNDISACSYEEITVCINDDSCCPAACSFETDTDCPEIPTIKCWDAENEYLRRTRSNLKKFCKCAEGTYGYQRYSRISSRATAYKYVDAGNNENWETAPISNYYRPAYRVRCSDGEWYPTNQDYFFS